MFRFVRTATLAVVLGSCLAAAPLPQIVKQGRKFTLMVDGKLFIMLGGQVNNSSGWPSRMQEIWPVFKALNANTAEIPVYWETVEPKAGEFHFEAVDQIVRDARVHNMRLILLWFATWKNGVMDYAPGWVKQDTAKYPRMIDSGGKPVRVLSPHGEATMNADRDAFVAFMRHLKGIDGDTHTVIMVQVENEPGSLFTDRDHSPASNKLFEGPAPEALTKALKRPTGTWTQAFGTEADEAFGAWHVARYINEIAAAGKKEYGLPLYVNVWLREQKNFMRPGEAYPSGGATSNMLDVWKAAAPAIDVIAPDIYVMDYASYRKVCESYSRPDNALLIPETGGFGAFARYMFYALADYDALGFAPFGIDRISAATVPEGIPGAGAGTSLMELVRPMLDNYRLLAPALDQIAAWQGTGKLHSAVEEDQITERLLNFTDYEVLAQFGRPQVSYGGTFASGTEKKTGRSMIAEIAPDEFVIIGFDTRVRFEPRRGSKLRNAQFLWVEEGKFESGVWKPTRRLNGDETFFGLSLPASGSILRAKLMSY
jgi:beta-galactosidase GanA